MPFIGNIKVKGVAHGTVLDSERLGASFSIEEMTELLYGGADKLSERRKLQALIQKDPIFSKRDKPFLSRDELFVKGLQAAKRILEVASANNLTREQFNILYSELDMLTGLNLHLSMFLNALEQQLTDQQKSKWLPLARNLTVIGTYAQTELGHGSFIRGLETTATLDEKTDEFIINSPSLTSIKWWPGNLGKTSNHCVVMAQLIVNGKNHGLQGFIVPIRDVETHKPLPGVEVGDIGPKFGYRMIDNGFLRLDNVRIPRDNMLMRYTFVGKDGKVTSSAHSKILYATMVLTRVQIVCASSIYLARAATIGIRYSAVRKQFPPGEGPQTDEVAVLNYQSQQHKLFIPLAASYAIYSCSLGLQAMYDENNRRVSRGDFSLMSELHAIASCLKSLTSELCVEGMEICRKSCGGHGYMEFCGIVDAYQDILPAQTYEGENTVMYLQTARYLVKHGKSALAGKSIAPGLSIAYIVDKSLLSSMCPATSSKDFSNPVTSITALKARSAFIILSTVKSLQDKSKHGMSESQAWDNSLVDLVRCSQAHALYVLVQSFHDFISKVANHDLKRVLTLLLTLFATSQVEKYSGELQESGFLSGKQCKFVREYCLTTLSLIRPDAVALVDAWDFSDYYLNSALGRYDGNVYQSLYEWAKEGRLNRIPVDAQVRKILKPLSKAANL